MKLSIQKTLVVLLVLIVNFTASGQGAFTINLHLYKPLAESRVAFEDSILTFYASYKTKDTVYFPIIYILRQDYSDLKTKQSFNVINDGVPIEFNEEYIRQQKTSKLIEDLGANENRLNTIAEPMIHAKRGLRKYDCTFINDHKNNTFHLFFGHKSDSNNHHFNDIKKINAKIAQILESNASAKINIHFSDQDKLCSGDEFYVNHSVRYLTYNPDGEMKSTLDEQAAHEIINKNSKSIVNDIRLTIKSVSTIKEIQKADDFRSYVSTIGVHFYVRITTKHKHPITGREVDQKSNTYDGDILVHIELNKNGDYSSLEIQRVSLPNFNNRKVEISKKKDPEPEIIPTELEIPVYETGVEDEVVAFVQSEPEYPGGIEKLFEDIYNNLTYPEWELQNKIQGTVYISFVVEKAGHITDIKIDRGVTGGPNLSKEAEKAVKKLKPFTPAQLNGKSARYRYRVGIQFIPR